MIIKLDLGILDSIGHGRCVCSGCITVCCFVQHRDYCERSDGGCHRSRHDTGAGVLYLVLRSNLAGRGYSLDLSITLSYRNLGSSTGPMWRCLHLTVHLIEY